MKNILIIPYATAFGDLIRHEPLIRALATQYPEAEIVLHAPSIDILKGMQKIIPTSILSFNFELIVNLNSSLDFDFLYSKKDLWGKLIGYTTTATATNQIAYEQFAKFKNFENGLSGLQKLYDYRQNNKKNVSQWICELCGFSEADAKTRFYITDDEKQFANEFTREITKPIVVLHPKTRGKIGYPFDTTVGMKDVPLERFQQFILQNQEFQFIVICAPDEESELQCLKIENSIISTAALRKNLALIFKAKYFVGLDSVASHVAYALDVPSLVLYCGIFKAACYPVNPNVPHILYSKEIDHVKTIQTEDIQHLFFDLRKLYDE